jgi:hypothetical protein
LDLPHDQQWCVSLRLCNYTGSPPSPPNLQITGVRTRDPCVLDDTHKTMFVSLLTLACPLAQSAYDAAESELFDALAKVDSILSESRFLCGEHFTEADLRLFPTIFRFDSVYHTLFRLWPPMDLQSKTPTSPLLCFCALFSQAGPSRHPPPDILTRPAHNLTKSFQPTHSRALTTQQVQQEAHLRLPAHPRLARRRVSTPRGRVNLRPRRDSRKLLHAIIPG